LRRTAPVAKTEAGTIDSKIISPPACHRSEPGGTKPIEGENLETKIAEKNINMRYGLYGYGPI
jgi:hypothetical protein